MSFVLDRGLNVAINHIAARLFPCGFDVAAVAPETLETLTAHTRETGRMLVWNGASGATIYGDDETNFAFRAWHDWCHVVGQFAFNAEGEAQACEMQQQHIRNVYGDNETTRRWCKILDAEINGQVAYNVATGGEFPEDQVAFVLDYLARGAAAIPARAAA